METYLKHYELEIKTKAPVFIGSGRKIGKKEYIYDRRENKIYFLNLEKMYHGLDGLRKMTAFQEYMLKDRYDLFFFMKNNDIAPKTYMQWADYAIPAAEQNMVNRSASDIWEFVKDPYGQPYVPGSSLKGALRTILAVDYFLNHPEISGDIARRIKQESFRNRNQYHRMNARIVSESVFHCRLFENNEISDIQNDMLRGVIVSDSEPLDKRVLCACQKIDVSVGGEEKKLNLLRECIAPETVIRFQVTFDRSVCSYNGKAIVKAAEGFYEYYKKWFLQKYAKVPKTKGNKCTFYLGGGAGYMSKAVTYAVLQGQDAVKEVGKILNATLPSKVQKQHDHLHDVDRGVSPHMLKCTRYNDQLYQMGACCITKLNFAPHQ